jgi:hypothetical protein
MIRRSLSLLALLLALPVSAEIYSWRDKDGRLHYSDVPPAAGEANRIETRATAPAAQSPVPGTTQPAIDGTDTRAADAARPKTLAEQEQAFRERRAAAAEAQAAAEKKQQQDAERQRSCEEMRNQLAGLESGQRVARFNAAGEREVLDDAARSEETARLRRQLGQSCT